MPKSRACEIRAGEPRKSKFYRFPTRRSIGLILGMGISQMYTYNASECSHCTLLVPLIAMIELHLCFARTRAALMEVRSNIRCHHPLLGSGNSTWYVHSSEQLRKTSSWWALISEKDIVT